MATDTPGLNSDCQTDTQLSKEKRDLLLKTKFFIPTSYTPPIIRPRLIDTLNDGLKRPLILVSAPAGYGKTTLVSNWLREIKIPSIWLSLDDGDNDPVCFLQYLVSAFETIAPDAKLNMSGELQGIQPNQVVGMINLFVNEISSFAQPFIFVLDDFHVIHSKTIFQLVNQLIEHMPVQMHLAILTRTDPPFPLSRFRVRNQLIDIRGDQLRFTADEIDTFLNETKSIKLSSDDLSALEVRTEGWIAGLQLAALSMQKCKDVHTFVSDFAGSHHYVMDYLVGEVLKQQPEMVSEFLLRTSILDRLCGPLCKALVDSSAERFDGQQMLESLVEKNLFTVPLDDERHWYRYHHLFTDVLRKRLGHEFPHLLPELSRRASLWYEQNGFIAESVQQAIEAGDQDRAAQLIEQKGCLLLIGGEVATLLKWADAIEFQSEARPWLAIQKAWALALVGDLNRVEPTLTVPEQLLLPLEPTDEVKTMRGTIAAARAYCANSRGDSQSAAKYAQEALLLLPTCSSISISIRSVVVSILGDASWIDGKFDEAIQAYTESIKIGKEANNLNMIIIANSNMADILMKQGQLHRAADIFAKTLHMAVRPDGQRSSLAAGILARMAKLSYEKNQLDEAEQHILQCLELCRIWGDPGQQAYACAILARLELARNNPEKTQAAVQEAELLISQQPHSPHWSIQVRSELARIWLAQGNLEKPSQHILKRGLTIQDEIPYQRENEYVLLLRVLMSRGDYESAAILSNRLLQQAETTGQMGLVIETLIIQALALQGKKETDQALVILEKALTLAQPEKYQRVFLDEGEAMIRLLCQAQSRQIGNDYAALLLSQIGKTSGTARPSMQILVEPLTTREIEVLKLIEGGCSNQDIAEKLFISIPTVKRHISNIYGKMGVKSRTQALALGKELNLFD